MNRPASPPELAHDLQRALEERREDIVRLCGELVEAPSVNPPGDTRAVAAVVQRALAGFGIPSRLETDEPTMPSVVAEIDSGRAGPHLILNVHMDTMPAGDEHEWSVPPFELTRRDGRLYGLGIGNMKGSVAAMIHALSLLEEHRSSWSGRVTFTAVSDEVVFGPNGAAHLLNVLPGIRGDGMLCGEGPGFRRLSVGEKGVLWLELAATGTPGHSSSVVRLGSATARLARAVSAIDELNGLRVDVPRELDGFFSPDDPAFELTANVGTVQAGTFIGQVAVSGTAGVDFRLPPGITCAEIEERVAGIAAEVGGITVRRIKGWEPNWTSPTADLVTLWQASANRLGFEPSPLAIRLPASDASRWRLQGVPAICFGPQPLYSAGIDDFVEEDEQIRTAVLFATTALAFLQPG